MAAGKWARTQLIPKGSRQSIGTETSEIENLMNAEHSEELLPRFRPGKIQPRSLDFNGGTAHVARNA
jgi:hypothetical protein